MTVVVQPVAELVELSRRCMAPTDSDEVDKAAVKVTECNTLRRSASKRFKVEVSEPNYIPYIFFLMKHIRSSHSSFQKFCEQR